LRLQRTYPGDSATVAFWREFTTPWAPDERIERIRSMTPGEIFQQQADRFGRSFGGGVFARANASPYFVGKITDLQNLRQRLRCAPPLRAPAALWTRPARVSGGALIVGSRVVNGRDGIGVPR
jgi:hypothetical protein